MDDVREPVRRRVLLLRVLAVVGLVLTSVLAGQALLRTPIPGCGVGSACETVLGTRWSVVLGVPVAGLAVAVYALLLGGTWRLERPAGRMVVGLAGALLIGAAIWFGYVQAALIGVLCPLCLASHVVGLAAGGAAMMLARPRTGATLAGLAAVGVLAAVQAAQPEPATSVRQVIGFLDTGPGPERTVRFSLDDVGGALRVRDTPHLGDPDAPAVLIEFFDYTCGFCRAMHGQLEDVQRAFGEDVVIVTVPVPLGGECNPALAGERGHAGSCDINRLALAVWRTKPDAFEAFHDRVFDAGPDVDVARAVAVELIGASAVDAAMSDPSIDAQLARNGELFSQMKGRLPQVIVGRVHIRGLPPDADVLIRDVAEQFGLTSVQSPADVELDAVEAAASPQG